VSGSRTLDRLAAFLSGRRVGMSAKHSLTEQGTAFYVSRVSRACSPYGMASPASATLDTAQRFFVLVSLTTDQRASMQLSEYATLPSYMPERLHQFRFDAQFGPTTPFDVTPAKFTGLQFPARTPEQPAAHLGRFIREVREEVEVISPQAAAQYLLEKVYKPFELFDQEETWVLLLNTKNMITHEAMIYRGTINSAIIRPVEIFKPAAQINAKSIILSHNHPSGTPEPSPEDVAVTRTLREAGQLLGVDVLDHIVVGRDCWVSLKERGLGFESE
jgi:DNA repair protein RadC